MSETLVASTYRMGVNTDGRESSGRTFSGWVDAAVDIDVSSRRVVGWQL